MRRIAIAVAVLALSFGCAALDGYERNYSLSYTDGKQAIHASLNLRRIGADGPDTGQKFDEEGNPNFGPKGITVARKPIKE